MRRLTPKILLVASLLVLDFLLVGIIYKNQQTSRVLGATVSIKKPPKAEAATVIRVRRSEIKVTARTIRKLTPAPTLSPSPTPQPSSAPQNSQPTSQSPTEAPKAGSPSNEVQAYIMGKINEYRASNGLSNVNVNTETCNFAKTRAGEIKSAFNHDGFRSRIDSKSLPYPSYSLVTENIAMTSNYKDVVNMWINSSGHAENMRKDTPFVCVEQDGNHFAYEGWKP
jgi:uncharacterized protein YkwD